MARITKDHQVIVDKDGRRYLNFVNTDEDYSVSGTTFLNGKVVSLENDWIDPTAYYGRATRWNVTGVERELPKEAPAYRKSFVPEVTLAALAVIIIDDNPEVLDVTRRDFESRFEWNTLYLSEEEGYEEGSMLYKATYVMHKTSEKEPHILNFLRLKRQIDMLTDYHILILPGTPPQKG